MNISTSGGGHLASAPSAAAATASRKRRHDGVGEDSTIAGEAPAEGLSLGGAQGEATAAAGGDDDDNSDAGIHDPLEPLTDARPIEGQGWDLVRLRQLADNVPFAAAQQPLGRAGAASSAPAPVAAGSGAGVVAPHPAAGTPAAIWEANAGSQTNDWVRDSLRGLATRGNGPFPDSVAHVLARNGKRIDGMLVSL